MSRYKKSHLRLVADLLEKEPRQPAARPASRNNMNDPTTIIRHYSQKDFDKVHRFWTEVAQLEENNDPVPQQNPIENFGRPNYIPEENLFVAEKDEDIAGYVDVIPELKIGRVILSLLISPEYAKTGLTERLVERAIERATGLKADRVHVNIGQDDSTAKELYSNMGFKLVRRFLELGLGLSRFDLPKIQGDSYRCRPMNQGEEDRMRKVQNRAFLNAWGFNPNAREDISYWIGLTNTNPGDILLCFDGDRPIGYCWTVTNIDQTRDGEVGKGRIHMLGVDPDYRGKGLGKQVLLAGLSLLTSRDLGHVDLTVDSENEVALALYESLGFAFRTSSLWYEKKLSHSRETS